MLEYIQDKFGGGMNLFEEDYALDAAQYGLAFNVRNRTAALSTVSGPIEDTSAPTGLKQGGYAFDDYVVLFNNGAAYYKNVVTDGPWTQISGFALSTTAEFIYAEAVPASKFNNKRTLQGNRIDGSSTETNVDVTTTVINTTEAGLVCQDGTNQPFLIKPDATARVLNTYNEWTTTEREYVPVMTRMKYMNGILFGVDRDGVSILRSVSGRPLDFVVNITTNGDKGGNARTTSYNVSYNPITCIDKLNSGELFVGTLKSCHPVEFNYDKTIFAEPTFLNRRTFSAGVVNHFSFIDILGDYCFVDIDGIRSYNAVSALQNEGRNGIFSSQIAKAFAGIKQSTTAAVVFDNYSIFAVTTIYGNVLAVYDNTRGIWVCFDNLGLDEPVKQFFVANQSSSPTLYAITASKVYKLYKSAEELEAQVYLRALISGNRNSIVVPDIACVFDGGTTQVSASVTQYVNNKEKNTVTRNIAVDEDGEVSPTVFKDPSPKQGWKIQPRIKWQNESKLAQVHVLATQSGSQTSIKQQSELRRS